MVDVEIATDEDGAHYVTGIATRFGVPRHHREPRRPRGSRVPSTNRFPRAMCSACRLSTRIRGRTPARGAEKCNFQTAPEPGPLMHMAC